VRYLVWKDCGVAISGVAPRRAKPFRYLLHHNLSIQDNALLTAAIIIAAEGIAPLQRPFLRLQPTRQLPPGSV
jgi:hypothetical protein